MTVKNMIRPDPGQVRQSFDRSVDTYDHSAVLEKEILERLLQRQDLVRLDPGLIIDGGTGTGRALPFLRQRYPDSRILAVDFAENMVSKASKADCGQTAACADLYCLPVANNCVDLIFCNLVLPWINDIDRIFSDHYQWQNGTGGPAGFKLEVPPMHPGLAAGIVGLHGRSLARQMREFPNLNALLALQRDGFDEQSPGGEVHVQDDERGVLDYPLHDYLWEGMRRAWHAMADIQFAAGAVAVSPAHLDAGFSATPEKARQAIDRLSLQPFKAALFSAHLMGGCGMGSDPAQSVIGPGGRHHHLENLSVIDGSIFPTSIGANPQLSIFGQSARIATGLAREMIPGALPDMPVTSV